MLVSVTTDAFMLSSRQVPLLPTPPGVLCLHLSQLHALQLCCVFVDVVVKAHAEYRLLACLSLPSLLCCNARVRYTLKKMHCCEHFITISHAD